MEYIWILLLLSGAVLALLIAVLGQVLRLRRGLAERQEEIKALEAQKQKILHPVTMRSVMEKAKAAGLTAEEIAEKLGLEM